MLTLDKPKFKFGPCLLMDNLRLLASSGLGLNFLIHYARIIIFSTRLLLESNETMEVKGGKNLALRGPINVRLLPPISL